MQNDARVRGEQRLEGEFSALITARQRLARFLDESDLVRGFQYAMQRRARIAHEKRDGRRIELTSTCQGSMPRSYRQTVVLDLDADGSIRGIDSTCDCPIGIDCKHVACVALTWLAGGPMPTGGATPPPTKRAKAPEHVTLPEDAMQWLEDFESALEPPADAARTGDCVVYALFDEGRRIAILKAKRLKDGQLGPASGSPDTGWLYASRRPPRYLVPADVAAYRALARLGDARYGCEWKLQAESGREAVERALETGRLIHLNDADRYSPPAGRLEKRIGARSTMRRGEPRAAPLGLVETAEGWVRWVTPVSDGRPLHALPVLPPMYLDAALGEIGDLDTGLAPQLAARLLSMPDVDRATAPLLLSRVARLARAGGAQNLVQRIPETLVLESKRMQPRLRCTTGQFNEYVKGRSQVQSRWLAELWFDYDGGLSIPEGSVAAATRWMDAGGKEQLTLRDSEGEAAVRRELSRAGFAPFSGWYLRKDVQRPFMMPGNGSAEAWAQAGRKLFETALRLDVAIDCDADFPNPVREAREIYQEWAPDGQNRWFELELGVIVEGTRIPIVGALAEWIRRTPDPEKWLERAQPGAPVLLNAGPAGLVRIPAERLRQLLAPVLETFAFDRGPEEGRLRLSRIEAALMSAPRESPRVPADLAALRERLRDFRGVAGVPPPRDFAARLRPYQQLGLDWLQFLREYGLAGILADDMGLGKTVQALAHLAAEKAAGRADLPSLVVAPTSVLPNWREEARRFAPGLRVLVLHGAQRSEEHARIAQSDLVITSYPLLARDFEALSRHEYHLALFDEAQFIKNARTQTRAAAAALRARHRVALTGTPIENNLAELWSHFDLLMPGFLGDSKQFARAWRTPIEREGDGARMERLSRRVRPFLLRRTRSEVLDELPRKTEILRHIELEGAQRDLYESLRIALDRKLRQAIAAKGIAGSQIAILDALLKLRQVCCDPRLVKTTGAKPAAASAKLEALREMLAELLAERKRVLLFSQFTSMLDLIEPELAAIGARHVRLDGSTADREAPVRRFQSREADVFLISLRAGGTGLNLTAADTVIHYDPWWNPAVEAQATARAHRIGQDKAVFVYKLIALGTVEERILELVERKRALAEALLGEGRAGKGRITEDDVRALLAPMGDAP